jgi:hypothetical protein
MALQIVGGGPVLRARPVTVDVTATCAGCGYAFAHRIYGVPEADLPAYLEGVAGNLWVCRGDCRGQITPHQYTEAEVRDR